MVARVPTIGRVQVACFYTSSAGCTQFYALLPRNRRESTKIRPAITVIRLI